jgi:hypothetical protein
MHKKTVYKTKGIKCKMAGKERKAKPKRKIGADTLEQINTCLNCIKPPNECKGDCFKKQKDEN